MSIHENLAINDYEFASPPTPVFPITYHQQDRASPDMYCGPACAQMVLFSLGAGLFDQQFLYNEIETFTSTDYIDWYSAPDELESTLIARKPTTFAGTFKLWLRLSEEAISRKLCWAIHNYGVAPIALVQGGAHWLVVTGYTASQAPTSASDTTYAIESFDIFDPSPPTGPACAPPPHVGGGDTCGTGDTLADTCNRGEKLGFAVYVSPPRAGGKPYWRLFYMTSVVDGTWTGQYGAICDPDLPANTVDLPPPGDNEIVPDSDVRQGRIRERARAGIYVDYRLDERAPWRTALAGTDVRDQYLVERLDLETPWFYYIVPFRKDSLVPVLALVDAYEPGGLAGAVASPEGTTHFGSTLERADVIDRFVGQVVVEGSPETLKDEELYEHLVWRPCVESLSPYWPFYRFDVGGPDGEIKVYVRIDGERFNELHPGFGM